MTPPITPLGSRYGIQGALGRSVKRPSVAGGGWWDLNGTITSCVAAYQPKGAASYAASLVNLTGNSTYDATEVVAPTWASASGWEFDNTAEGFDVGLTGLTPSSTTVIARYWRPASGLYGRAIFLAGTNLRYYVLENNMYFWGSANYQSVTSGGGDQIAAVAGYKAYLNGSFTNDLDTSKTGTMTATKIGQTYSDGTAVYLYALAIYNSDISSSVSALTAAMAAL